jgi:8-oxo-dGTP pyrophosphatase MutT (NUDIX family)
MKIFINEKPVYLASLDEVAKLPKTDRTLLGVYRGKVKLLLQFIDTFEKSNTLDGAIISAEDKLTLIADFKGLFKSMPAAGGVVFNQNDEILMIFRRGFWDLPKGKIDKGEAIEAAAVREVKEETGLKNVDLGEFLTTTYHVFTQKGTRILKPTFWYKMKTSDKKLIPQKEEDIEQAIWISKTEFFAKPRIVYKNIVEILKMV